MRVPLILTIKTSEPSSIGLSKMSHSKESGSQPTPNPDQVENLNLPLRGTIRVLDHNPIH